MHEIELKFLVPESRLKGLMRQAKVKSSQDIHMSAHYFDTPKQELAAAGIGLRIRQEGETWVQTIKAGGDGIAARLEHNTVLDTDHVQAMLADNNLLPDLTLYKNTAIAPALMDFKLKKLAKNLTRQYVTDVQRTTRLLEDDSGEHISSIEMAYDYGAIIHGSDDTQRQAIQEIEFELIAGELGFLFATAKVWCKRYKLCLSTVTKAERGGLLINKQAYSPAAEADLTLLQANTNSNLPEFIRAVVHNCLLQILPNSSAIADGSNDIHHAIQLAHGLTRLSTALQTFGKFSEQLNNEWLSIVNLTTTSIYEYVSTSYVLTNIEPILQKHGAPSIDWSTEIEPIKTKLNDAVCANDFQLILLELIEFVMSDLSSEPQADKLAIDKLSKILAKKQANLLQVEQDNNSDIYRQLTELRYIAEFAAPLYPKKASKRWIKRLVKAQKSLEKYQQQFNYQQRYKQKSVTTPSALYGAGWLAATLLEQQQRWQKHLYRLQECPIFW
ncbi:CYTH and CHAD domain-containing protein [Psychrobacter sp. GP33]|uniref:CYTH and CHAD domain-containing protein n=1 Tax=Psychrobacter sp. GP33 TaxID=2758709 RepID=UPI0015F792B8|nr:CYTH and CHAD domain-containing protein [Psychrobacter sp. GP33]